MKASVHIFINSLPTNDLTNTSCKYDTRYEVAEFLRLVECYSISTAKYLPEFQVLKHGAKQLNTFFFRECEGTTILQKVETYLPVRTALYIRIVLSSNL